MIAQIALAAVLAAPRIYVATDREGGSSSARLSVRGESEVEVTLERLPVEPGRLLGTQPAGDETETLHQPPLQRTGQRLRDSVLASARELYAGLSAPGRELAKGIFGLRAPLAKSLPEAPLSRLDPSHQLVQAWRFDTPEPGWNYVDVDLGELRAGLYALTARGAQSSARVLLTGGSLGLLGARLGSSLTVLSQDRDTGTPRSDCALWGERGGKAVLLGRTGADGLAVLRGPLPGGIVGIVTGVGGQEVATLAVPAGPGLASAEGRSGGAGRGAVILDRRFVQPGNPVGVFALFRTLGPDGRLQLPDSNWAEAEILDREAHVLLRESVQLSALGTAAFNLDLPPGLAAGDLTVAVAAGEVRRSADLTVLDPGPPLLSLSCREAGPGVRCEARDGLGRPEPGVALRWRVVAPADGPFEVRASGRGISGADGALVLPEVRTGLSGWLEIDAVDGFGRSSSLHHLLERSLRLKFQPERRLLRPGHTATLSLEASVEGEPYRGRLEATALEIRPSPTGDIVRQPIFERTFDTDSHGRVSVPVTAATAGFIEVHASVPGSTAVSAHATLFVSEAGGDIPTIPERLLLVPEAGERRRGEELRLLVQTPFDSGAVLLSFVPPVLPSQALFVRGYSGVARLVLPALGGGLAVVASALHGGRVYSDRLQLLRPRPLPMSVRAALERAPKGTGRPALSIETLDEGGQPIAAQLGVVLSSDADAPGLGDLLEPPLPSVGVGASPAERDSLSAHAPLAPDALVPYGPAGPPVDAPPSMGALLEGVTPISGRTMLAAQPFTGRSATALVYAAGGPSELGEARLRVPAATPAGKLPERRAPRASALANPPATTALASFIQSVLSLPPANGPSADLACAAVRMAGGLGLSRTAARGPLARLAQLENLEGGFGDPEGELRRDTAALRGLRGLGSQADADLVERTRGRVRRLAELLPDGDAGRAEALAAATGTEVGSGRPPDLTQATARELAGWLAGSAAKGRARGFPRGSDRTVAAARVRQLLASADELDLAELALAANRLRLNVGARPLPGPAVTRVWRRLVPSRWTQTEMADEEEPPEPRREPVGEGARVGDELETELSVPLHVEATFCLRDFPPAGLLPEGFAPGPSGAVLLCGQPRRGSLRLAYRSLAQTPGSYESPPPALGVGSAVGASSFRIESMIATLLLPLALTAGTDSLRLQLPLEGWSAAQSTQVVVDGARPGLPVLLHWLGWDWALWPDALGRAAAYVALLPQRNSFAVEQTARGQAQVSVLGTCSPPDLVIAAEWESGARLDLQVTGPDGEVCDASNRTTTQGGVRLRDDPEAPGPHVFVLPRGQAGEYELSLACGRLPPGHGVRARALVLLQPGTRAEERRELSVAVTRCDEATPLGVVELLGRPER